MIERKVNGFWSRDPSERASCGTVEDASWRGNLGVLVPMPTFPVELMRSASKRAVAFGLKMIAPLVKLEMVRLARALRGVFTGSR